MTIYVLLFVGILISMYFEKRYEIIRQKVWYNSTFIIIFSLIMGLRSYNVGADTELYFRIYNKTLNGSDTFFDIAPAYYFFIKIFSLLNLDYRILIFVSAIIINVGFFIIIWKLKLNRSFAVFLYVGLTFLYFSMNGTRQILAMIIAVNSLLYLNDNLKSIKGWILFLISINVHITSLTFILAIFCIVLLDKKISLYTNKKKIFIFSIFFAFIMHSLIYNLLNVIQKILPMHYFGYINGMAKFSFFENTGAGRIIILYLFLLSLCVIYAFFSEKTYAEKESFSQKIYPVLVFTATFGVLEPGNVLLNRILLNFIFLYIPFLSQLVDTNVKNSKIIKIYIIVGLSLYSFASLLLNHNRVVPYSILNM